MTTWTFDPTHTTADFTVRHMMVTNVRGRFGKVSGTLEFDPEKVAASSVEATIDAASIETGVADRDNHLRSADFLDEEHFPTITFRSTKVEPDGDGARITGDLTIRGVTREVVIEAEYMGQGISPYGHQVAGFSGSTKINREDFGLTWNVALETGGWLVGKDIKIALELEAVRVTEGVQA